MQRKFDTLHRGLGFGSIYFCQKFDLDWRRPIFVSHTVFMSKVDLDLKCLMKFDESVACKFIANTDCCVIHDPCFIRIYTIIVPTKAQKYIDSIVYTQ
jgi:hypothetical protein